MKIRRAEGPRGHEVALTDGGSAYSLKPNGYCVEAGPSSTGLTLNSKVCVGVANLMQSVIDLERGAGPYEDNPAAIDSTPVYIEGQLMFLSVDSENAAASGRSSPRLRTAMEALLALVPKIREGDFSAGVPQLFEDRLWAVGEICQGSRIPRP